MSLTHFQLSDLVEILCNDLYPYGICGKLQLWTNCGFWFRGVWTGSGAKWSLLSVAQWSGVCIWKDAHHRRLLTKWKKLTVIMPHHMTLLNAGIVNSNMAGSLSKQLSERKAFPRWCSLDFWSHVVVGGPTWGVLQKRSPELHQTMGEMHNSGWFLCRERLITVPSFVALLLWEVGQGHYLLNAPCISQPISLGDQDAMAWEHTQPSSMVGVCTGVVVLY